MPVEGVGANVVKLPPIEVVYHFNEVPVAVSAVDISFWQ